MKIFNNHKKLFFTTLEINLIFILISQINSNNISTNGSCQTFDSSSKYKIEENQNENESFISILFQMLENKLALFTKEQQAYIGALIVSSASVPVFLLIMIFNVQNLSILNIMSAFSAGALVGDVLFHNLPEIFFEYDKNINTNFLKRKETCLGLGIIFMFVIEKAINLLNRKNAIEINNLNHNDNNIRPGFSQNIILSMIGDFIHNVTDGLALGAAYGTNLKLGITLTLSIFFHEIPHEVGDFSFLLKQKMGKIKAFSTQVFSAIGAFFGVYLSFIIGDAYIINTFSFATGTFLYLSINTILGDIEGASTFIEIFFEMNAFLLGFYILYLVI